MKIVFICGYGVSCGMIANKPQKAGQARGYDVTTEAYSYAQLSDVICNFDVVLVAPQMSFNEKSIAETCEAHGKKYAIVDDLAFATLDGEKCFNTALKLMGSEL
jgi:PTS system cellobiose-specific IIB component